MEDRLRVEPRLVAEFDRDDSLLGSQSGQSSADGHCAVGEQLGGEQCGERDGGDVDGDRPGCRVNAHLHAGERHRGHRQRGVQRERERPAVDGQRGL